MNASAPAAPRRHIPLRTLILLGLIAAGILLGYTIVFAAQALHNPGFEDGMDGWQGSGPTGNWKVVGTETPAAYPTYAQMGNVTITPASGTRMLRLGVPQGKDNHQVKAVTRVSQTFTAADTDRLAVCFRLLSWEHREGRDALTIDIKRADGTSVGRLEYPVAVRLPNGTAVANGALPYTLSLDIGAETYLDSDWVVVRLAGIPKNEQLTLTYTLNTDRDAAHDSWVYIDWWNDAPTAALAYAPAEPVEDEPIQLSGSTSTDPNGVWGDYVNRWDWTITDISTETSTTISGENVTWTPADPGTYRVELRVMDTFGAEASVSEIVEVAESNKPPVAVIDVLDAFDDDEIPDPGQFEGEYVELVSVNSDDPNGKADIASYHWTITGPTLVTALESDSPNVYFVPPREGTYTVRLKVADRAGLFAEVSSEVVVQNSPAGVSALNVEVLPGQASELLGRFVECGWLDTHLAHWTFGGQDYPGQVREDGLPQASTGAVRAAGPVLALPGESLIGKLVVSDDAGASSEITATVLCIADDPMRDESNDTLVPTPPDTTVTVPTINAGSVHLSYVQSAGDVDFFELKMPNGDDLPYGTELLVVLKDLPADYDLAVFEKLPEADFGSTPINRMPINRMPINRMPINRMPINRMPINRMPINRMPINRMPVELSPINRMPINRMPINRMPINRMPINRMPINRMEWGWIQLGAPEVTAIPLTELSYLVGPDYQELATGDIAFSELGLDALIPAGTEPVAYSADRALGDEAVLVKTQYTGSRIFVAVTGANGASSLSPYALQVEAALPYSLGELYPPVPGTQLVTVGATNAPSVITPAPVVKTLIVTSPERMKAYYGEEGPNGWNALQASLAAFAARPDISGEVIALPSSIFNTWDVTPYSVEAANLVADAVRTIVSDYMTADTKYVVLVGGDRVIPHRRFKDQTQISNELYYAESSLVEMNTPLAASLFGGYDLTDDFYVDAEPSYQQGLEFYVPDLAIGRLVEEPSEIQAVLAAYVENGGLASAQSAVVTGYDFFTDGAGAVSSTLTSAGITPDTLVSSQWTAAALMQSLIGGTAHDLASVNAHFMHFAALSAGGWTNGDYTDLVLSSDILGIPGFLSGTFVYSMGCHSGLDFPDGDVAEFESEMDIDPSLDFAQAMAAQGASFIGPTGFGLGDTAGIGGTERLVGLFTQQLSSNGAGMAVGDALVAAKRTYLSGLGQLTCYDVKSCIDWTLYGLPMYRVTTPRQVVPSGGGSGSGNFGNMGVEPSPFYDPIASQVWVRDNGATTPVSLTLTPFASLGSGTYFAAGTPLDTLNVEGRPIQPSLEIPLASTGGSVHGLFITGGAFTDLSGGDSGSTTFDPVIGTLTTGWMKDVRENTTGVDGFWPAAPAAYNTYETGGVERQSLVLLPGQFKRTSELGVDVTGTQRLYTQLGVEVLRSTSDDILPPTIAGISLYRDALDNLTVAIDMGSTPEAVRAIEVVAVYNGSMAGNAFVPQSGHETNAVHVVPVTNLPVGATPDAVSLIVQVADAAGNVAVSTGKGATLRVITVDAGEPQMFVPGDEIPLTGTVYGWSSLAQPVTAVWDFGDGSSSVVTSYSVNVDGTIATFPAWHDYATDNAVTATFRVTDAYGGTGSDTVTMVPLPPPVSQWFVSTTGNDVTGDGTDTNPWRTIQHALDTADAGATINVAPGTYNENVRIWKDNQVLAGAGAAVTVVVAAPAAADSHALEIDYNVHDVEVENLTITGGVGNAGAGIFCDGLSSSTFTSCQITNNLCPNPAGSGGAGLWAYNAASVDLIACDFTGNRSMSTGGAIGLISVGTHTTCTITDCLIRGNQATDGAGIYSAYVPLTITGGQIHTNVCTGTPGRGGAVYVEGTGGTPCPFTVSGCIINNNQAYYGAGIWSGYLATPNITGCWINANTGSMGAGIYAYGNVGGLVGNNLFWQNTTAYSGAGVWSAEVVGTAFVNNTVVANTSTSSIGGGLYDNDGTMRIFNCIFAGNLGGGAPDDLGGSATTAYSYIGDATGAPVNGNIHGSQIPVIPPEFVNPAAGDFHLQLTSPLIDAGTDSWLGTAAPGIDIEGLLRPDGFGTSGLWDMGAYEVPQS